MLLPSVLLETEWVLRTSYSHEAKRIAEDLSDLASHPNARVVSMPAVLKALEALKDGADFADMLHLGLAQEADATSFATFDRGIMKAVQVPPIPVETLT